MVELVEFQLNYFNTNNPYINIHLIYWLNKYTSS